MVELSSETWSQMVNEATSNYPLEGCGVLLGSDSKPEWIEQFVSIGNALASPTEYRLDPAQFAETVTQAAISGLDVVGVMHSHPTTPANPSKVDVAKADHPLIPPWWHWVIVSLADGDAKVQCFSIAHGDVRKESMQVSG